MRGRKIEKRTMLIAVCCLLLAAMVPGEGKALLQPDNADENSITGELTVLYADDFGRGKSRLIYVLKEKKTGRSFSLRPERSLPKKFRTGAVVTVHGKARGNEIYLAANGEGQVEMVSPAAPGITGEQKTIVIIADFLDEIVSCSANDIHDLMYTDPEELSVDDYYQETSFGKIWFNGETVGPYTIPYASDDSCDYSSWAGAADSMAADSGMDLGSYSRRVYVIPQNNSCGYAGLGTVGGNPSRSWVFYCAMADVYAHELGHNLGMNHASTLSNEYGDTSDVMGYAGYGLRRLNAPHMEQAGWLDPGQLFTAISSGTYEIAPLEINAWEALFPQSIRISKPDSGEYYYLSYRQPLGFDGNLMGIYVDRLNIHRYRGDGGKTYLLDVLLDGESFVDTSNGVRVTQVGHTPDSVTVDIQIDTACLPAAPEVVLSPASYSAAAGLPVSYALSVANIDSPECASSTFSLTSTVPEGWTGGVLPGSLLLAPGESGSATLTATSPADATDGAYGVIGFVTDPLETIHDSMVEAGYIVVPPCLVSQPNVSLTPPSDRGAPGTTVNYTVSVGNTDSPGCGDAVFSLDPDVPGGWTGQASPVSLDLAPGTAGSATLSVTSSGSSADGAYGVQFNIYDPLEPLHVSSGIAVYLVESSDTIPPEAPTNLTASVKRKQVSLSWDPASDNLGVIGYQIFRDGAVAGETPETAYNDRTCGAGQTCTYSVRAFDASGNVSGDSNRVTVTNGGGGGGKAGGGGKGRKK